MEIGDVVDGRYRLLELLGEGAAGKVYRSEDLRQGQPIVALKLLHAKDARWENFFRREFEVLSGLTHPNLVQVYDFGPAPEENTYYFTQELVVGKPLLDAVAGMRVVDVVGLFIEICRALEFIHAHGVLHRDLKPANIMVNMNQPVGERVRVLDFGLWRELDNTPKKGARWAGTPLYLASEVLRGYGHSVSADLYAVGVTLFQAITRKLPHGRGTPQELLAARKKEAAPDLSHRCSEGFAALVRDLLLEDAKQRPASAAEVGAALSAIAPKYALSMPLALGRARLVGRKQEREIVWGTIRDISEGRKAPRLIIIEGEDGMGKSRLIQEMKAQVQLEGGRAGVGYSGNEINWAYRPIAEMVRALAPGHAREELFERHRNVMEQFFPESGWGDAAISLTPQGDGDDSMSSDIASFFHYMAKNKLCALFFEDIEICDTQSLAVIYQLLQGRKSRHLVILATKDPNAQLPRALERIDASDRIVVRLTPLKKTEVLSMVQALLGIEEIPDNLLETLWVYSKGIPLHVEDYLAVLLEREEITRGDTGWNFDGLMERGMPSLSGDDVVQERLRLLPEAENKMLAALAVFNQASSEKMLAAVTGITRSNVKKALTHAEAHGILSVMSQQTSRPHFAFRHPSFKDAILEKARLSGTLPGLHLRSAQVLEERAEGDGSIISETLAYHYEKGESYNEAVHYLSLATDRSMGLCDVAAGLEHARRAARILREQEDKIKPQLFLGAQTRLARILFVIGDLVECNALLQSVFIYAREKEEKLYASQIQVLRARLYAVLGITKQESETFAEQCNKLRSENDDIANRLLILAGLYTMVHQKPVQVLRETRRLLSTGSFVEHRDLQLMGWDLLTQAALKARRYKQAIVYAKRRMLFAEKFSARFHMCEAQLILAISLAETGQRLEARRLFRTLLEQTERWGARVLHTRIMFYLAKELFVSGALSDAVARVHQAISVASELSLHIERLEMFCFLGDCLTAMGDYEKAFDQVEAALKTFGEGRAYPVVILALLTQADATIAQGLMTHSDKLLKKAAKLLKNVREHGYIQARLYKSRGWMYMLKGDFVKSRRAFMLSILWHRRTHHRFAMAKIMVDFAQLLLRNDQPKRALRMVSHAQSIFKSLDAKGEEKRLQPLRNAAVGLSRV